MTRYVVFDKDGDKPPWMRPENEANATRNQRRSWEYWNHIWNAQPAWADVGAIRAVYREAGRMRAAGEDMQVDHIVPLNNPYVCGLHVHYNLRVITAAANRLRANNTWPDCPHETRDLFEDAHASPDWELNRGTSGD